MSKKTDAARDAARAGRVQEALMLLADVADDQEKDLKAHAKKTKH